MKRILVLIAILVAGAAGWASAPQRIVVAGIPLYTEILLALGLGDRIVAVAESPENPKEVLNLPKVGPVWAPSLEAILGFNPDLVLGAPPLLAARLRELGVPAFLLAEEKGGWITSIVEVLEGIVELGRILGVEEKAQALSGSLALEILALEAKVLGLPRPSVAVFYVYDPSGLPYVAGRGTPEDELIWRAGGTNAFADLQGYPQVSLEQVLTRNPEIIFVGTGQKENLVNHRALKGLHAVEKGRIWEIHAAHLVSTKVVNVLAFMAKVLHPQAFEE